MTDANFISNCAAIATLVALCAYAAYLKLHPTESRSDKAFKQFLATRIPSSNPKYAFDGHSASIVQKILHDFHNDETTAYVLTIYARNASGEYFSFRSDGEKAPLVRHMEQSIAKIVLKRDYIPLTK